MEERCTKENNVKSSCNLMINRAEKIYSIFLCNKEELSYII